MEMHPQKEEINMLFHAKNNNSNPLIKPQSKQTNKNWNCVMCTLENNSNNDHCVMCNGPSPIKHDLWGKRICQVCNTINSAEKINCKNCNQKLTGIVDYNENAQLLFKQDKKPDTTYQQ
eukprot:849722_1